jgi:redox-sensing transcriptional repressor
MTKRENISMSVVRRLPRYYRFLSELMGGGVTRISSRELSARMGLTASQIRQDLNCFGGFGQQGYGYIVEQLHQEIGNILGLGNSYRSILIGAGNLGRAVATHMSFEARGFRLAAIFDKSERLIGNEIRGIPVQSIDLLEKVCSKEKPQMAVLCVPRDSVAMLAERMYALGIKNYWNFSHYDLAIRFPDVIVENVHMSDSLMTLCYRMSNQSGDEDTSTAQ